MCVQTAWWYSHATVCVHVYMSACKHMCVHPCMYVQKPDVSSLLWVRVSHWTRSWTMASRLQGYSCLCLHILVACPYSSWWLSVSRSSLSLVSCNALLFLRSICLGLVLLFLLGCHLLSGLGTVFWCDSFVRCMLCEHLPLGGSLSRMAVDWPYLGGVI